jgi:ABC-2 type transport system permease protein
MLIGIELSKIFRKWRSYIGFAAVGLLAAIVQTAIYFQGSGYLNFATRSFRDSFEYVGNLLNGYLVAHIVLQALYIHIPFLIVLVGGDLLAGEATAGTYRMLISRPISRFQIVMSKFIAGLIYTILLLLFLMIMSLGVSLLIFGTGELIVVQKSIIVFARNDILWRFIFAYGFATLSLGVVLSLSFFFSSLVENAIGPIFATMAVIIIFMILSAMNIEGLKEIHPYLFVTHMTQWTTIFDNPIDYSNLFKSMLVLIAHIVGLFSVTFLIFKRKDILS